MASKEVAPEHAGREGEPVPEVTPPEGPRGVLNVSQTACNEFMPDCQVLARVRLGRASMHMGVLCCAGPAALPDGAWPSECQPARAGRCECKGRSDPMHNCKAG